MEEVDQEPANNGLFVRKDNPVYETEFLPGRQFEDIATLEQTVLIELLTLALMPIVGSQREFADENGLRRVCKQTAEYIWPLMIEKLIDPASVGQLQAMQNFFRDNRDSIKPFKGRAPRVVKNKEEPNASQEVDKEKTPAKKPASKAPAKRKAATAKA